MKLVINACFGGFSLPDEFCSLYGMGAYDDIERDDPRLIEFVESKDEKVGGFCSDLEVVEIPDESTDYYINEYDGAETVIYVVGGKLHFIG